MCLAVSRLVSVCPAVGAAIRVGMLFLWVGGSILPPVSLVSVLVLRSLRVCAYIFGAWASAWISVLSPNVGGCIRKPNLPTCLVCMGVPLATLNVLLFLICYYVIYEPLGIV
jgi:hypothetical protein